MDSLPHDIYVLIVYLLDTPEWMRWAMISKDALGIILPCVQKLQLTDANLKPMFQNLLLFGSVRELNCFMVKPVHYIKALGIVKPLIDRMTELSCPSSLLSLVAKDATLKTLTELNFEPTRVTTCRISNKVYFPNIKTIRNLDAGDFGRFLEQPLRFLTYIGITIRIEPPSVTWIRVLSTVESKFELSLHVSRESVIASKWERGRMSDKIVEAVNQCDNITNLSIGSLEGTPSCIRRFIAAAHSKPLKSLVMKFTKPKNTGVSISSMLLTHPARMEHLDVEGVGYGYNHVIISEHFPSMSTLRTLELTKLTITTWSKSENGYAKLDFPLLEELRISNTSGVISSESTFPSLRILSAEQGEVIGGLITSIKETAAELHTVTTTMTEYVIISKKLRTLSIIRAHSINFTYYIPGYLPSSEIKKIVDEILHICPPLQTFRFVTDDYDKDRLSDTLAPLMNAYRMADIHVGLC